jgi:hypothetical protein
MGSQWRLNAGGNFSVEQDFRSWGANALLARDFNRHNTTLSFGASYESDDVIPHGGVQLPLGEVGSLDTRVASDAEPDRFFQDSVAAAFGGTTTLIDFAIQYKGQPLRAAFDAWMQKAANKATTDYAFHCIITDLPNARLDEMGELVREGVTSFKLFMAYPGVFMLDDATIFKAMQKASNIGGMICMHAENGGAIDVIVKQALAEGKTAPKYHALTRPTTAEAEATSRAIALAEMAGSPVYIVHLSCNDALEKVREARDRVAGVLEGVVDGGQALHVVDRLVRGARCPYGESGQCQDHRGSHGDGGAARGEYVQDSLHGDTARPWSHVYTSSSGIR